jgi:hypothetical protein
MRLLLFFATAIIACGQPVLSRVEVLATHGTVRVVFETSDLGSPMNAWIEYGVTPQLDYSTGQVRTTAAATSPVRSVIESGLTPSTRYFFRPAAKGPSGTSSWRCSEGGIGWSCDTESGLGIFTTSELPAEHPAPPALIAPVQTRMPAINGQTFEVAVDATNRCVNFQEQLRACAAADQTLNHQVLIPAGASCVGTFQLPPKIGEGTCVVRTSARDSQLPPEGVRIDPSYEKRLASIVAPARATGQISDRGALNTPRCNSPVCTQGWRFLGIQFTVEDQRKLQSPSIEITSVREDGVITTARAHGLTTHEQIYVSEVEGYNARGPNGVFRVTTLSPTTLRLQFNTVRPTFTCDSPPCHKPGTGRIIRAWVTAVQEATNTSPVVIKTAVPHGLSSFPKVSIVQANNGVLTFESIHGFPTGRSTVLVEGSSNPQWNGYWTMLRASDRTITIQNAPQWNCAVDCGAVSLKETLQVGEVEGNTAANGAHPFTVLSPTEIQLDGVEGNGDYTSGGFIALDPDLTTTLLTFYDTSDRIILDRCYVNGRGFPHRILYAVQLHATNSGIVDSWIDNVSGWRSIHPKTKVVELGYAGAFVATSVAVEISNGSNKKIHNNYLSAEGITLFAQEGTRQVPENIQITRNRIFSSPTYMAGSPVSDGRYYPKRHHLEFKRARRVLIDGNIIDGNWSDYTPCGPSLALSIRGSGRDNVTSDFAITNNVFRNTSSAIQIGGVDSNADKVTLPTARIRVHNNLFYEIDNRAWTSNPIAVGSSGICGYAIQTLWSVEDVSVTNNTAAELRGKQPQFFTYSYGRSEGVVVRNNVFTHNQDNGAGAIQLAAALNLPGMQPRIAGTPAEGWSQYFRHGSDFSGNVVIPGVKNTSTLLNLDLAAANVSVTKRDCENYYSGFRDIVCAGTGSESETASQRLDQVFVDSRGKDFHTREFPGKGADLEAIAKAIGSTRDSFVQGIGSNEALIRFFAASEDACSVDYTTDPEGDCERVVADGAIGLRTVALTNLTPATQYYFRVQCPSEQLTGRFETLP